MNAKWLKGGRGWIGNDPDRHKPAVKKAPDPQPADDDDNYAVIYRPLKCPRCKSKKVKIYSTKENTRYCLCRACDHRFKAIEASDKD